MSDKDRESIWPVIITFIAGFILYFCTIGFFNDTSRILEELRGLNKHLETISKKEKA